MIPVSQNKNGKAGSWPLFLLPVALSLVLAVGNVGAGTVNFTVSPSIIEFDAVQGAVKVFTLTLYNQGTSTLEVRMGVRNFSLDPEGVSHLILSSNEAHDWARYVELDSDSFDVEPGESHPARAVIKVPRGKIGGGYCAVVFYARPKPGKQRLLGNGLVLGAQLGTLFIGEISRTGSHKARIISAEAGLPPYSPERPLYMKIMLENTGTTHIKANGTIILRDEKGKVIDRVDLEGGSGLILPNGRRYFRGCWTRAYRFLDDEVTADIRFRFPGGSARKSLSLPLNLHR